MSIPASSVGTGSQRLLLHAEGKVGGERLLELGTKRGGGKQNNRVRGEPVHRIVLVLVELSTQPSQPPTEAR